MNSMFNFIEQIREVSGKPVGIKMVIGSEETFEELVSYMAQTNRHLILLPLMVVKVVQEQRIKQWLILSVFRLNPLY
jgi:hypothetical protein